MKPLIAIWLLGAARLAGQAAGVMPDWEARQAAATLEKNTRAVGDVLAQLRPKEWAAAGASELYIEQLDLARQAHSHLAQEAQALGRQPEKLSLALGVFFRLDHLESLAGSLAGGARQYQNAPLADLLQAAISRSAAPREKLKEYIRQLAVEKEQECEIAHQEAQRCRESLAKQPPPKKPAPPQP